MIEGGKCVQPLKGGKRIYNKDGKNSHAGFASPNLNRKKKENKRFKQKARDGNKVCFCLYFEVLRVN